MLRYLITDPAYYHDEASFEAYLTRIFSRHHPDYACFRDKRTADPLPYARRFLEIGRSHGIARLLINSRVDLAEELGFDGVHLPSARIEALRKLPERLLKVASTHTLEEALLAQSLGADAITVSPIFASPGKGEGRGLSFLCSVAKATEGVEIFALGGIVSEAEVRAIEECNVAGFASIRYFV